MIMSEQVLPFIRIQMQKNRTASGRRTSTPAKHAARYCAYGNVKSKQEGKQRGEWLGPNSQKQSHEAVMAWAQQEALQHRYTCHAIFSLRDGALTPQQFCHAMQQGGDIQDWRLMAHSDTAHSHAHILFFRDKRLDKQRYLTWHNAVGEALSTMEKQHVSDGLDNKDSRDMQTALAESAKQKGMGLGW
jgi:hypothetical protein